MFIFWYIYIFIIFLHNITSIYIVNFFFISRFEYSIFNKNIIFVSIVFLSVTAKKHTCLFASVFFLLEN